MDNCYCVPKQVISQKKDEGVFLWIHLKPTADHKACGKIVAQLQKHVDALSPPDSRDESDEIWAGVGEKCVFD